MAYSVLIKNSVAAQNVDAWNRSAVSASALENGFIVKLGALSTTSGEGEVFVAAVPATGSLTDLWMVYQPENVATGDKYKNLDPDPRNFINAIGDIVSVYKPQLGDIITMTADGFLGTKGSNGFVNATDTTGGLSLYWGASKTSSVLSYALLATTYISIPDGSIGTQRVTAYKLECVGL